MEYLLRQVLSHIHHLCQKHHLINSWFLTLHKDLHGLVSHIRSLYCPLLVAYLFTREGFLDIQCCHFLADSDELFNVLLEFAYDHFEIVSLHFTTAISCLLSIIKIFKYVNLSFEITCQSTNSFPPCLNSVFSLTIFDFKTWSFLTEFGDLLAGIIHCLDVHLCYNCYNKFIMVFVFLLFLNKIITRCIIILNR